MLNFLKKYYNQNYWNFIAFLGFILFLSTIFIACSREKHKQIKLYSTVSEKNDEVENEPDTHIYFAIAPVISAPKSYIFYEELIKYLEKKNNFSIKLIQRNTYQEINSCLKFGLADLGLICTASYIKCANEFGLELLAIPQVKNKIYYRSYIIVNKKSGFTRLEELKNKSFAFCDPLSLTGFFYPISRIRQFKIPYMNFFSHIIFTNSHDNSVKAVSENIVDGAAVHSIVYENMLSSNEPHVINTKIIERSPEFGAPPIVVRPGFNQLKKKIIQDILLKMHTDPEGSIILSKLSIDKFLYPDEKIYSSAKTLMREIYLNQ